MTHNRFRERKSYADAVRRLSAAAVKARENMLFVLITYGLSIVLHCYLGIHLIPVKAYPYLTLCVLHSIFYYVCNGLTLPVCISMYAGILIRAFIYGQPYIPQIAKCHHIVRCLSHNFRQQYILLIKLHNIRFKPRELKDSLHHMRYIVHIALCPAHYPVSVFRRHIRISFQIFQIYRKRCERCLKLVRYVRKRIL